MPFTPRQLIHFCGSCAAWVACWAVWLVLGALLAVLLYVAVAKELPVPGFVLRRIEGEMARSGLSLTFGRARFDPTGKVLLQDVRLRAAQFEDPLLTCRLLYVRHDFWSLLSGWTFPEEIQLEGAALQLPAMLAPGGTTEPLVRELAVTLRHRNHLWRVEQFAGHLGPLSLSLSGEFTPRRGGTAEPDLQALTARYLQFARRLAPVIDRLQAFDQPALALRIDTDAGGVNRATLLLTAAGARQPWGQPISLGPFAAGASLNFGHAGAQTVPVQVAIRRLDGPAGVSLTALRAVLRAELDPVTLTARAGELRLAAGAVATPEGELLGPILRADLSRWPSLHLEAAAQVDGEALAAGVEAELAVQSARVHLAGRANAETLNRVLARHTPRAAPYFVFDDRVAFDTDAVLAPGWKFDRLAAWVDTGRMDSHGVKIGYARGRIAIAGRDFLAHDVRLATGDSTARGSYWMDFGTTDYRMLLAGRLYPLAINGWFRSDWWSAFWNRWFVFPAAPPTAEVDIQGRWRDPRLGSSFVRAHTRNATIWGGDFDAADATVFVRPAFTHGLTLTGTRAAGSQQLTGSFKRFGVPGGRDTARFEFDFTTNADPAVLGRMLEGRADGVLASLRFTAPPTIHAWGALAGEDGTLRPDYRFTARAAAPLHYYGFPLASARVQGGVTGSDVVLDGIEFAAGGGTGAGKAALSGPTDRRLLSFDLFLNKARLGDTVHAVQEYQAARAGATGPAGPDSQFVRKAAGSLLDVTLSAQGDPADITSFQGKGQAGLTGGALGEVHLFGLLSQVLSAFSLSFSSLKLDSAHTGFEMAGGELLFSDLKVTGPSAVIDARGKYNFTSNALDFTAKFKPYDQPGSPLAAVVGLVISPLASILELKLNGPLGDPRWSFSVSPGSKPAAPTPTPVPPAATPPAK